ncbi:MAG: fibronectin type III domain-containing protein, partial [Candidatus Latescibacterota bacterium]
MKRTRMLTGGAGAGVLACVVACHDAPRENPLDPVLTPPVELQVSVDSTAGTAALTWTPYAGRQPFAEYRVLRSLLNSLLADTLAAIVDVTQTTYVDSTLAPHAAYEYQVVACNRAGYAAASERQRAEGYGVRPVALLPLAYEPWAGAVRLRWRQYRDPGFASYAVHRRQVGTDADSVLATVPQVQDTTFTDSTARHQVDYLYT